MTPAFNLLDEPWIPVRTHTGEVFDINLSDALLKARDYAALAETSPPNLIALYRLLLATLHRALTSTMANGATRIGRAGSGRDCRKRRSAPIWRSGANGSGCSIRASRSCRWRHWQRLRKPATS